MRPLLLSLAFALTGCEAAPNEFPAHARTAFHRTCPADDPVCACTWDKITRTMTAEEYAAALDRFRDEGLMDPAITRARTGCLDRAR